MAKKVFKKIVRIVKRAFNRYTFKDQMEEEYEKYLETDEESYREAEYVMNPAGKAFIEAFLIPKFKEEFKRKPRGMIRIYFYQKENGCFYQVYDSDEKLPMVEAPYGFMAAEQALKVIDVYGIEGNYGGFDENVVPNSIYFDLRLD